MYYEMAASIHQTCMEVDSIMNPSKYEIKEFLLVIKKFLFFRGRESKNHVEIENLENTV